MSIRRYVVVLAVTGTLALMLAWRLGPREEMPEVVVLPGSSRWGAVMTRATDGEFYTVPDGALSDRIRACARARISVRRAWLQPAPVVWDACPVG